MHWYNTIFSNNIAQSSHPCVNIFIWLIYICIHITSYSSINDEAWCPNKRKLVQLHFDISVMILTLYWTVTYCETHNVTWGKNAHNLCYTNTVNVPFHKCMHACTLLIMHCYKQNKNTKQDMLISTHHVVLTIYLHQSSHAIRSTSKSLITVLF